MVVSLRIPLRAGWVRGKTPPDVQSMLLLANLFGTTIDELVRGDVDEMRAMVEKNERRTKTFAVALAAVEVVVVTALAAAAALAGSFALGRFARPRNRFASSGPLPYPGQRGSLVLERRGKARLHVKQVRTFREPFRGP